MSNYIVYECRCGEQVKFLEQERTHLAWLKRKFGFGNVGEAIGQFRECCDRPEYVSVGGN